MERYRNLIETNIAAVITLYTNHKPGLYENSLSNKGQLSAWRLLETADLLSIVENLYRTGGKMLLVDPLSRLCAPGDGFYDVSLPGKVSVLLQNLPQQVAECNAMRVSANKDTAAVARMVQKWRKPTNPISQGKLSSYQEPKQQHGEDDEESVLVMVSEIAEPCGKLRAFSIVTPHADTGVREIRELINSGKAITVLTPISLIPQIARGCNEVNMDEAIAGKVNQMTKIVMASTADAWLIHIPGLARRHEIFTAEQLAQDSSNLEDLVISLQDPEDDCPAGREDYTLSYCLFTSSKDVSLDSKPGNSLSLVYRELEKLANAKELIRIPVLVQTRAQRGELSLAKTSGKRKINHSLEKKRKEDAVTTKQRQSPFSSWIGKQLLGQKIPKRYLDGDGNLQMMQGYPHGLLAIPSDGYSGQRIVVPVEEQKSLIKSTHAEITKATPKCTTFYTHYIIGQGWTPPLKQSAPPAASAFEPTDAGKG